MATFLTEPTTIGTDVHDDDGSELEALVSGITQTSQSTLLLKKRKQMREIDSNLEFTKTEFKSRMAACTNRQLEFERKQKEMREHVSRFEKFIHENDSKRQRAEMKATLAVRQRDGLEKRIQKLGREMTQLKEKKKVLSDKLAQLKRYETFLEDVVERVPEEFEEVEDVLKRHTTLLKAHDDLQSETFKTVQKVEAQRESLNVLRADSQNSILLCNSGIHERQKRLEAIRLKLSKLEAQITKKELTAKTKQRESGEVMMAIVNLYQRCASSLKAKVKPVKQVDGKVPIPQLLACLGLIEGRVLDLQEIANGYDSFVKAKQAQESEAEAAMIRAAMIAGLPQKDYK